MYELECGVPLKYASSHTSSEHAYLTRSTYSWCEIMHSIVYSAEISPFASTFVDFSQVGEILTGEIAGVSHPWYRLHDFGPFPTLLPCSAANVNSYHLLRCFEHRDTIHNTSN